MGGSQLKQLRSTIKDQGLSQHHGQNQSKKRKRSLSGRSGPQTRNEKLAAIHESFNTFDTKVNKRKFDVDRPNKGKPGQSKQAAIDQRRKTLLPELQNRNRTGGIVDRRIGEGDAGLSTEEKALERFALERQRMAAGGPGGSRRKSAFNLEEEDELTHLGRSLANDEDPSAGAGLADQQDAFQLSLKRGPREHSDDEDQEAPRKKSRAEIMDEVIKKSKAYKAERQKARDADDELRLQLDEDLEGLRSALRKDLSDTHDKARKPDQEASDSEGGSNEDFAEEGSDSNDESDAEQSQAPSKQKQQGTGPKVDRDLLAQLLAEDKDDDKDDAPAAEKDTDAYDQAVKELGFEKRVRPTDRLKTEDERIKEAAEALQEAEDARQRRMRGESEPESDGAGDGKQKKNSKKKTTAAAAAQADDLEDDFDLAGDANDLGAGLQEEGNDMEGGIFSLGGDEDGEEPVASGSDQQSDEDQTSGSEGGSEEGDEDEYTSDLEELIAQSDSENEADFSGDDQQQEALVSKKKDRSAAKKASQAEEVGFVFPCPATHDELLGILEGADSSNSLHTIIDRIRTLHHPKLAPENNDRLATFLSVLLDHALYLTAAAESGSSAFETVNILIPHLFSLSKAYPLVASHHFRNKINLMHKNFLRGSSLGVLSPDAKTWPGAAELTLLRLVGLIWSTSDLSHPVVAPAMLLMCEYLGQARVRNLHDLRTGLFLCSLILSYESMSKRIVPEVLNFLSNGLLILAPHTLASPEALPGALVAHDAFRPELADCEIKDKSAPASQRMSLTADTPDPGSLLLNAESLVDRFAQMWVSNSAFIEMFTPILACMEAVKEKKLGSANKERHDRVKTSLSRMLKLSGKERRPLRLQHHKPVPIPTFVPKFEEGYQPGRPAFDPDSARNEEAKLKSLIKKERKGAIRELRKDNRFIAEERAKMRDEKDQAYNARINSIRAGLESERAEEKDYEREKARAKAKDRKRAGGR